MKTKSLFLTLAIGAASIVLTATPTQAANKHQEVRIIKKEKVRLVTAKPVHYPVARGVYSGATGPLYYPIRPGEINSGPFPGR